MACRVPFPRCGRARRPVRPGEGLAGSTCVQLLRQGGLRWPRASAPRRCRDGRLSAPSSATFRLRLFRQARLGRPASGAISTPAWRSWWTVDLDLVGRQHDQEIGLAGRDHGAEDLRAEAHVAGDRAAALAHAVDLGLLHVEAGAEGGVGQDVGGLEHALPAQAGDDDVGDVAVVRWHRRSRRRRSATLRPPSRRCSSRIRGSRRRPAGRAAGRRSPRGRSTGQRVASSCLEAARIRHRVDHVDVLHAHGAGQVLDRRRLPVGSWSSVRPVPGCSCWPVMAVVPLSRISTTWPVAAGCRPSRPGR